jgi:acyl-[acyl-carrier-protein]-phospholipid O-acyltransferase/long-chain-fatty-acid--[acyl-carrier-protein] ligase
LAALLFRVRVKGGLPAETPRLLVVANHESFLDGLLLGLFLPLDPVFVVHTGVVRNPVFRLLLGLVDYLAVDPTSPMAMKKVIRDRGRAPGGDLSRGPHHTTGSLMKTYDGPAFVAAKTGATILPVRIDGAARTYFSRLAAHVPRKLFPQIGLFLRPTTHRDAGGRLRAGAPPQGRRSDAAADAGDDLRQPPQQTLFEALLDAAASRATATRWSRI